MSDVHEGGCQCGAVRYRVEGDAVAVGICHCTQCQKQSGSAFGMSFIVPKEAFQLLSGSLKTFTRMSDKRRDGSRVFSTSNRARLMIRHSCDRLRKCGPPRSRGGSSSPPRSGPLKGSRSELRMFGDRP